MKIRSAEIVSVFDRHWSEPWRMAIWNCVMLAGAATQKFILPVESRAGN